MTAVVAVVETVDCLDCNGQGFTWVQTSAEHQPLDYVEASCTSCRGEGVVPAEWVSTCTNDQTRFWAGDGCTHGDTLCYDCRPSCSECADDAREDAGYDAYRDMVTTGVWS